MKDLIPSGPSDQGLQLMEPMGSSPAAPPSRFKLQKLLFFLRKFWWIPVLTLTLSLGVGVTIFYFTPPVFVSFGSLWETDKMQLPGGAAFVEDRDSYLGTQVKLLQMIKVKCAYLNSKQI